MDDDCITCPLPEPTSSGDKEKIEYFNHLVRLTHILSSVLKFLSHLRMRGMDPNWLIRSVQHLNAELRTWTESVPPPCRPEPLRKDSSALNVPLNLILYIRCTYFGLVITLNSSFTHPWLLDWIGHHGNARFQKQIDESTELVIKASRDAIQDTKHIDMDFTSPVWLVFYYPLVGLIHLFVHIVKSPQAPTVQLDLALLDIISGHFARLKYTTSSTIAFPFVKELCRFAEHTVDLKSTESSRIANDASTIAESAAQPKYSTQGTVPGSDARVAANNAPDVSEVMNHAPFY
ncbi:hypothetical protein MPH_05957 [Macrophomina phaseolina MS6]|uniref:Uncharacterized protein n=1 Tax=Macrophomina phaseolina (strain MS6) TaxID=1126212 RepID=K2S2V8_MACPH|nr:hypothetical protein MPH_05957 [Macrophomina phaseolina MS6]